MKVLKKTVLYLVPLVSIVIFAQYVLTAGGSDAWATAHGVDPAIADNYRNINAVSLLAWLATAVLIVMRKSTGAQLAATFATAYVLCDVVFYIPMARLAGESFPFDQLSVVGIQAVYALALPRLMGQNNATAGARDLYGTR